MNISRKHDSSILSYRNACQYIHTVIRFAARNAVYRDIIRHDVLVSRILIPRDRQLYVFYKFYPANLYATSCAPVVDNSSFRSRKLLARTRNVCANTPPPLLQRSFRFRFVFSSVSIYVRARFSVLNRIPFNRVQFYIRWEEEEEEE